MVCPCARLTAKAFYPTNKEETTEGYGSSTGKEILGSPPPPICVPGSWVERSPSNDEPNWYAVWKQLREHMNESASNGTAPFNGTAITQGKKAQGPRTRTPIDNSCTGF